MTELWLDASIGGMLIAAAAGSIFGRTLVASVCLFIAFGMLLSIAWVRLEAVDLALAEAAIGAGLTGFLLFRALIRCEEEQPAPVARYSWWAGGLVIAILGAALLRALPLQGPLAEGELVPVPRLVQQEIHATGVEHPVTAVLLSFRAWDTLLELAVLLVAFLGIRHLRPAVTMASPRAWPLPLAWSKFLAPLLLVGGVYLLWEGAHGPGGAFQAGTLLAAAAVVLRLNGLLPCLRWSRFSIRLLILAGLSFFLLVAATGAAVGEGWLHYPPAHSASVILAIEVAATLSIAATLTLLVASEPEDLET